MDTADVLVIDDQRTFRFPAVYARTAAEGISRLTEQAWREVWLDHNLGPGLTIEPVLRLLEERATRGRPLPIGVICVHTSGLAEGDAMVAALAPWYRVRRLRAHSFLSTSRARPVTARLSRNPPSSLRRGTGAGLDTVARSTTPG